jgi:large subunit ribosomal protein L29
MKVTELKEMTLEELRSREQQLAEEIAQMRLQLSVKRLDNPLKIRATKRDLARVKTVIGERVRAGEASGSPAPKKQAPAQPAAGREKA